MKSIYIDVLITVNVFIDFILILCTKKALCLNAPFKRILLASLLGGAQSMIALLPPLPFVLNIPIDLICAAGIVFIAFGRTDVKRFIKRITVFTALSFTFCGIMLFLYNAFHPKGMEIYNDTIYFNISPVLLIVLTLICYYILKLIKILCKSSLNSDICNIEIEDNKMDFSFCAKTDSGCNLREPFSGKYVIIVEKKILENYMPDKNKLRIIPFESLGGNGTIHGFPFKNIKINGKAVNDTVYIGLCENVLKGDIKALIPYELVKLTLEE